MKEFSSFGNFLLFEDSTDQDGMLEIAMTLYGHEQGYSWIDKDTAIKLISHLEEVFLLKTEHSN